MKIPKSDYKRYCEGASISGPNKDYIAVVGVTCGQVPKKLTPKLDQINAYDIMEKKLRIGQVNMIIVSSFCRAGNPIWGLDIAKVDELEKLFEVNGTSVYNGMPLHGAGRALFRRYPIAPGAPVFFAAKDGYGECGEHIYAALGIGVPPKDDHRNARLFMEDVGKLDPKDRKGSIEEKINKMVQSVLEIGKNQKVKYEKIIVLSDNLRVSDGHTGGAMPAVAYVSLAKKALPLKMEDSYLGWLVNQDKPTWIDPRLPTPDEPIIRWESPWHLEHVVH